MEVVVVRDVLGGLVMLVGALLFGYVLFFVETVGVLR
jgi:hypothetical protein